MKKSTMFFGIAICVFTVYSILPKTDIALVGCMLLTMGKLEEIYE